MKTFKVISALMFVASLLFIVACDDDKDEDPTPSPSSYFTANIKFNGGSIQSYVSDEFDFEARVDTTGNDTLVFEGERSSDGSYMYFNVINQDLYSFASGDSISIPYDFGTGTEIFCSILINSVSNSIFQPVSGQPGMVYIEVLDYSSKYIKGQMYGTFISGSDTLEISDASFLIDL
ncbi:MAG: hypothetical protein KBH11_11720 [Bacteroidia bacterium]|nr:hypothetical protein [Bacteroidota bacterium]MBK8415661.1 hypothetical protein [Bacteroidota bacterium]MBK9049290.1 hypothetical protein [Bacteroidota bacterium]MBL0073492.1 hypothetical protein [Bacteroidota bacterium]MBP9083736.1 hypothetical protein [Bacteroidia bacterium]